MGGWWGEGSWGSRSGVVSLHICLHVQKSGQEKPQPFMGLIILHSTQSGSFVFSAMLFGVQTWTEMFLTQKSIIHVFIQQFPYTFYTRPENAHARTHATSTTKM